jgi:DNA-binding response OmpR family regulator
VGGSGNGHGPSGLASASATAARVLVVDPDLRFGLLLKGYLQERGWAAEWVPDGRKALSHWEAWHPDVLVTELQGEDLDGFEFLESLRHFQPAPPVVVCTKLAGAQAWTDGMLRQLGVRAVLVRPVRFPEVARTLEELVSRLTGTMPALTTLPPGAQGAGGAGAPSTG